VLEAGPARQRGRDLRRLLDHTLEVSQLALPSVRGRRSIATRYGARDCADQRVNVGAHREVGAVELDQFVACACQLPRQLTRIRGALLEQITRVVLSERVGL
jgi:hypothetical protein